MKCDTCERESDTKVVAGRWLFYCIDNELCKQAEIDKIYENEMKPSLDDETMPDPEVLELFV